jgi:hypothetical protein
MLEINSKVYNNNNVDEEFISLIVISDCNLSNYLVLDKNIDSLDFNRCLYRFPDMEIKRGSVIRLHTGKGKSIFKDGIFYFYMNLDFPIWYNFDVEYVELYKIEKIQEVEIEHK